MSRSLPLPLLLNLLLLPFYTIAQTPPEFLIQSCPNAAAGSQYQSNLYTVLSSMSADTRTTSGFYHLSSGLGPARVNAIGLCRGDVGLERCRCCINNATRRIVQDCPDRKEAIGYYDLCMVRFSNRSLDGVLDPTPVPYHGLNAAAGNGSEDPIRFDADLRGLLARLRSEAAEGSSDRKFATGATRIGGNLTTVLYGLVQCSPDLSRWDCEDCLSQATAEIPNCCGSRLGRRVVKASCNLRFDSYEFYEERPAAQPPTYLPITFNRGSKNTRRLVYILFPVVGSTVLGIYVLLFWCGDWILKRWRIAPQKMAEVMNSDGPGKLQFDLDTIRDATNDFADGRKLGEGGFGAVYKGTLSNGEDIAVKRLSRDSRQGDLEFKNEGELVAKLQHRNLVRLLGFCLKGSERLLVYEFVPNASLDHFIFDPNKRAHLNWERRYKIIGGVTRGLVYLHEDSRLRIVHRDLKAGNILLDAEMNPKIADFGLARHFDLDKTQGSTRRIVGTYGYMAPEYLIHGNFSIKSDVFSYGVLVLEIVSGQRNKPVREGSNVEDLLTYAWKSWRNGTFTDLVDPSLEKDGILAAEIMRCIHIGLLCVQKNVEDRPTMATVAQMLTNYSLALPMPSKPAFFMQTAGAGELLEGGGAAAAASSQSGAHEAAVPLSLNEVSMTELCPR